MGKRQKLTAGVVCRSSGCILKSPIITNSSSMRCHQQRGRRRMYLERVKKVEDKRIIGIKERYH